MKKQILFLCFLYLCCATLGYAQVRTISGKVTDTNNESVPGVNIYVKGTNNGTVTNLDGTYSLGNVEATSVLVFQAVGYKTQEVAAGVQSTLNVVLEIETKVLENVVVTGYRELERTQLTGSVALVSSKEIETVPMSSFDQILQGRAAGVMISAGSGQPGASANVRIRGYGSINASVQPLYILDGVPISEGDFTTLNPNDFERVDVLKGGAATAQYGSRGSNGVLVITTKRGREGRFQATYRTQFGWSTRTRENFSMMNTAEKIQFERLVFDQFRAQGTSVAGSARGRVGQILANTSLTPAQREAEIAQLALVNTDWTKVFFRTGTQQTHDFAVGGGNSTTQFKLSFNYRKEEGILVRSSLDRYTLNANLDHKISKNLRVGMSMIFGYSNQRTLTTETGNNLNNPVLFAFLANPYYTPYAPDGSYLPENPALAGTIGFNLRQQMDESFRAVGQVKLVGSTYLEYDIPKVKGLTLRTQWGMDYASDVLDRESNPTAPNQGGVPGAQGFISRRFDREQSLIGTTSARFVRAFGEKHNLSVLVANEIIVRRYFFFSSVGYGLNRQIPFPVPTNGSTTFFPEVGNGETSNSLLSAFADINYSFNGKYNFSFGARRDGSSRFGSARRYGNFFSVGASWNVMKENFIKNVPYLSSFVFRTNYGTTGNQNIAAAESFGDAGNFAYLSVFTPNAGYAGIPGIAPTVPNPNLGWERGSTFEVGFDAGLFKDRVTITFDFYNRVTNNLFLNLINSATVGNGAGAIRTNAGSMRNRGIELTINADVLKAKNFVWTFNGNITFNQNRITSLGTAPEFVLGTSIVRPGLPFGTHYLVRWAGVNPANGDALYFDREGNITSNYSDQNQTTFGTFDPPRYGGFTNTFRYKSLELSLFFTFAHGHQLFNNNSFFNQNIQNSGLIGQVNKDRVMFNMWTTPGQITDIPRVDVPTQINNSKFLEDGSFLRLRNVILGYNLPQNIVKRAKLSGVRVYAQGQNLLTFTKFTGFDPENANNLVLSNYPAPRAYTFGLDITF